MNSVVLIGRVTKEPEVRYGSTGNAVGKFTLAVGRGKVNGKDMGTDFPAIVCFGKTAELVEKYVVKGQQIGIQGRIQTGSYEKEGKKFYTTEVLADKIEFLSKKDDTKDEIETQTEVKIPEGFEKLDDDDIPFD